MADRRGRFLLSCLLAVLLGLAHPPGARADQGWDLFKSQFLRDGERVVDPQNGGITHSEAQGYAMFLAVANDDRPVFERLWAWTDRVLRRPDGALFTWKFDSAAAKPVTDRNNATDGDIFIAWALARAGQKWNVSEFGVAAADIRRSIAEKLVVTAGGRTVLLPGLDGFRTDKGDTTVNLSYYVMPALQEFEAADGAAGPWAQVMRDGRLLLLDARFGRFGLNPDWLTIDAGGILSPARDHKPYFGYDAVRIPLYFLWGHEDTRTLLAPLLQFWSGLGAAGKAQPAWVDLRNGTVADFEAPLGATYIRLLATGGGGGAAIMNSTITPKDTYYSSALALLTRQAAIELH